MKFNDFQEVFNRFSERQKATKAEEHDVGKVRDKFTEIVDATGIDINLLRSHKDEETGKMILNDNSQGSFCFPEGSVDFCVEIIIRYTSSDFKLIRKGDFDSASSGELLFLIDGFIKYLDELGYPLAVLLEQQRAMDRRLGNKLRMAREQILNECDKIIEQTKEYEDDLIYLNYDDKVYFLRYMADRLSNASNNIAHVFSAYSDIRSEELSDLAEAESKNLDGQETIKYVNDELLLAYTLENDNEYQRLLKEREKILGTYDFVKRLKGPYSKTVTAMNGIRKLHEVELFGKSLQEEDDPEIVVKHPLNILQEAIQYADECDQERIDREEKDANKTPEEIEKERLEDIKIRKFLESKGMAFDLPNTEDEEEVIFMNCNLSYEMRGMISFPCCSSEKIVVYEGSTGHSSIKCPHCGKYAIFNFNKMTAETITAIRGASQRWKNKK